MPPPVLAPGASRPVIHSGYPLSIKLLPPAERSAATCYECPGRQNALVIHCIHSCPAIPGPDGVHCRRAHVWSRTDTPTAADCQRTCPDRGRDRISRHDRRHLTARSPAGSRPAPRNSRSRQSGTPTARPCRRPGRPARARDLVETCRVAGLPSLRPPRD